MAGLGRDIRDAVRHWRATPGLAVLALGALALGIGATTALFALTDALLIRTLPVRSPDSLVQLMAGERPAGLSYRAWKEFAGFPLPLDGLLASSMDRVNLASAGEVQYEWASLVSSSYFHVLGVPAAIGRVLGAADDRPDAADVAVVSHAFWQRRLGGRADVLGQTVRLDGAAFSIVGVLPKGFDGLEPGRPVRIFLPLAADVVLKGPNNRLDELRSSWLGIHGRLRDGDTVERASAALAGPFAALDDARSRNPRFDDAFRLSPAARGHSFLREQYGRPLLVLLAAVALVLLIACVNLAALVLARFSDRHRELAVRLALGASRAGLVRALLTESLLMSANEVLVAEVTGLPTDGAPSDRLARLDRIRDRLLAVPGVTAVSAGVVSPLSGTMAATQITVPGSSDAGGRPQGMSPFNRILPGYFDVVGTPLVAGRDFERRDTAAAPPVVIINEAFAERHFKGRNPLGRLVQLGARDAAVVGIVADARVVSLNEARDVPMAFGPIAQWGPTVPLDHLRFLARGAAPRSLRVGVLAALRDEAPRLSVALRTMADDARRSVNREHLLAWCGGLFAVLGLVMAAAGLYGTFAYAVIRRRLELGIRAAVGANPSRLRLLVLRDGALVLAGGIAAGLLGVAGSSRVLGSLLVNVVPGDTVALTTTLSALAAVVAPAIWLPARRAAAIDPATALRHD